MNQPVSDRSGGTRYKSSLRGWHTVKAGVLLAALAAMALCALSVDEDTLDAAAVVALTRALHPQSVEATQRLALDPHFMTLTPLGLELIAARTRRVSIVSSIDEFEYRTVDGDAITLVTALAPLAHDEPHWTAQRIGNVRLLCWTKEGKRYVLAGHANTRGLMRAADALTIP